ncbi:MAG: hypothetical protein IKW74_00505, partial [Thermoguttaceae bacterium]|nr:hypothetical protein [Thermoguttaceae bacterium]
MDDARIQVPSVSEAFGSAVDCATGVSWHMDSDNSLNERPFSVDLWVKLNSADNWNIFMANEEKVSPRHWEFYSFYLSGELALYIPGNSRDTLKSQVSITDGKWHYVGFVMGTDYAELFLDGRSVDRVPLDRPVSQPSDGEKPGFSIGSLVVEGIGCNGSLDELRITKGIREFSPDSIPVSPATAGEDTILLCHFEPVSANGEQPQVDMDTLKEKFTQKAKEASVSDSAAAVDEYADVPKIFRASPRQNTRKGDILSYDELEINMATMAEYPIEGILTKKNGKKLCAGTDKMSQLFPTGGLEIEVKPGEHPPRDIPIQKIEKADFDRRVEELGLQSVHFDDFRAGVFENWGEQYFYLSDQLTGKMALPRGAGDQVYDENALVFPDREKQPVQVILRRAEVLADYLKNDGDTVDEATLADLARLKENIDPENEEQSVVDYFIASALRRNLMFANAALSDLDRIMFLARGCYAGCRLTNMSNSDRIGGHFATQVYGFNTIHGGGLFAVSDWKSLQPQITDLIQGKKVQGTDICSRLAGKELNYGSFMSPELSFDGKTIYFSHCGSKEHRWIWTPDTTWNIFKMPVDGDSIEQLTDSAYNDFDVCELPSGRLVFCSERRGGFIRCFAEGAELRVTTSVLHSMKNDGSDIYPISFFETSEWQPSVDNNGMLVYTRWDYTDRENCLGSTYWTCFPDGRNPRSPQGNYPFPWFTFEDNKHGDHRFGNCPDAPSGLPMTQMQYRAIPDSHKYIFTAAPHHGETFGSLCILDLRVKNDNHMSQIRRITPYVFFPESEGPDRSQYRYGAPWPINEDVYLCNSWENLVLLDRFGNEELICERELLPIGYDPRLRLSEPIPLAPRFKPALISQQTAQGEDYQDKDKRSTIGVFNVNIADLPFPKDRPIKRLRVLQAIPKPNPWMDTPWIGYATENTPRIPLGTVPVEEDGSAYFEAPSGKQLIFQVLDENNMAIQTMRAVTFLHPGEKLICTGCHEPVDQSVQNEDALPIAFQREPSKLEPECGPVEPVNFYRMIKPIFDQR